VRRVVVLGGTGFFGAAAVERLRADGLEPLVAARHGIAELRLDVSSRASIKAALRPFDVVVDAVGPYQSRSTALIEAAIEIGFDVIDLSDSLEYAEKVEGLRLRIEAAGIRVLTSCSSVSAISAAAVRLSGFTNPVRLAVFLSPATRFTANPGTSRSLLNSLGAPIRVFRGGRLVRVLGWREARAFRMPLPLGRTRGFLCESADGFLLPRVWPSLRRVDFYVHSGAPLLDGTLSLASRSGALRRLIARTLPASLVFARLFGSQTGCLAFEVEDAEGSLWSLALVSSKRGYFTAVAPAVLAARAIAQGRFDPQGFVPPDRQVDPAALLEYLVRLGVDVVMTRHGDMRIS
jgi:saccharopine dehydrogenase-like NADP-dependent oxidoreductase